MMQNSKSIGNKIAEARKKINLSQADLAQQVSISAQAVGKWERGESMPDITTLNRLAEIFGVDLNYFSESFQSLDNEKTSVDTMVKQSSDFHSVSQKNIGRNMSNGNWVDADFSGLKNLTEKFNSSNIQRCKFIGSDLSGLLLKSNFINTSDFSNSNISNSKIHKSYFENNQFNNCLLKGTEFTDSYISKCDMTDADLTGMTFKNGGFEKNKISNTIWYSTIFTNTKIIDIVFEGTIKDCSFENCGFKRVTFKNTTITNTFFKQNYTLKQVKFVDCKVDRLTYEFLKIEKADLSGITLLE
jgi:transcriptional regulator with XRE-family HTH domain